MPLEVVMHKIEDIKYIDSEEILNHDLINKVKELGYISLNRLQNTFNLSIAEYQ